MSCKVIIGSCGKDEAQENRTGTELHSCVAGLFLTLAELMFLFLSPSLCLCFTLITEWLGLAGTSQITVI